MRAEDQTARARSPAEHQETTQARRCRALLSSVILLAVDDACTPIDRSEQRVKRNRNALALSGLHFLFHPDSTLPLIADLLDLNVEAVRFNLRQRARTQLDDKSLTLRSRLLWLGNPLYLELPPQDVIDKLAARWRDTHA